MKFTCFTPTELCFGAGRFTEAGTRGRRLGTNALVVTSRSAMDRLGHTGRLVDDLARHGVRATVFNDLRPGVLLEDVDRGAELARRRGVDCVVALGGGTALDAAKAIAGVAPADRPAADYLWGRADIGPSALPLLVIPTTAGTGSEVNRSSVVTDPCRPYKDAIRSDYLFPRCAIVDPLLTHDLPPEVTAATGFDALAHAVESYVSPKAQPLADLLALTAIKDIVRWLPLALAEPHHAEARAGLALAATTMGWHLSWVGTCFPHRIDKALCALHPEISHGQSVALFYPHWAFFSWAGAPERFARVAELLDPCLGSLDVGQGAEAGIDALEALLRKVGLARRLQDFGVCSDELPILAENVAGDLSVNPIPLSRSDVTSFLASVFADGKRALHGALSIRDPR
jgi:alcohol dehydrogenase class IV